MKKGAFDRHDIDDVDANQGGAEAARKMEGVGLRGARVFGSVEADQDAFDQRQVSVLIRDITPRAEVSRGSGGTGANARG